MSRWLHEHRYGRNGGAYHHARTLCSNPMTIPLQEYVNGQLKCKYGDCFIRGNNGRFSMTCLKGDQRVCVLLVLYISAVKGK